MARDRKHKTDFETPTYLGAKKRYIYDQMYQLPKGPHHGPDEEHERENDRNDYPVDI